MIEVVIVLAVMVVVLAGRKPSRLYRWSGRKIPQRGGRSQRKQLPSEDFYARVHRVIDGDTFDARLEGSLVRVRLAAIDCPEEGQHWGQNAKYGLIKLIGGQTVFIEYHGQDEYQRIVGTVYLMEEDQPVNVNEVMVLRGHAWVMRRFYDFLSADRRAALNRKESWSRRQKVGLWGTDGPIPPWVWRQTRRRS